MFKTKLSNMKVVFNPQRFIYTGDSLISLSKNVWFTVEVPQTMDFMELLSYMDQHGDMIYNNGCTTSTGIDIGFLEELKDYHKIYMVQKISDDDHTLYDCPYFCLGDTIQEVYQGAEFRGERLYVYGFFEGNTDQDKF